MQGRIRRLIAVEQRDAGKRQPPPSDLPLPAMSRRET